MRLHRLRPRRLALVAAAALLAAAPATADAAFPYGDHWYENPLGFRPLELHTANALLVAGAAAGLALLWTSPDGAPSEGRVSAYAQTGLAAGYKAPYTTVLTQELGALFHARRWLALGAELAFHGFSDRWNDTAGVALRPMVRWYPVSEPSFRLFFESGAGLILTADEFPAATPRDDRTGLRLNGVTRYGVGFELRPARELLIVGGVRHQHVSNGNVRGAERNPSHDSNGVFLGVGWRP